MKRLLGKLGDRLRSRRNDSTTDLYRRLRLLTRRVEAVESWVNEQRVRALVREMWETPEGRDQLKQWFGESE